MDAEFKRRDAKTAEKKDLAAKERRERRDCGTLMERGSDLDGVWLDVGGEVLEEMFQVALVEA
jgi:hypothetical protein